MSEELSNTNTNEEELISTPLNSEPPKKGNINLILNVVLLIAVAVLFFLHFKGKNGGDENVETKKNVPTSIAYVNSDSLLNNYEYVKVLKTDLEAKQKSMEGEFSTKQKSFEYEVTEFQKKVNSNTISQELAQKTEQQLMQKQQALGELQQKMQQELSLQELEMNTKVLDTISSFMKKYNKKHNYNYILGYAKGSGILFANESFNITGDVLKQINKEYKEKPIKK
ncbi:MAG: OmpH family outer membrane protein [Bacteroidetes bacterium]|nr:OmpH family outer membrane protein [Bacteroidota bacterium]